MYYRLFGTFEMGANGYTSVLGPHQRRTVLAVLLLDCNEVVTVDRLIDQVWGEQHPHTAAHAIQVHVSELRKQFESLVGEPTIVYSPPGYMIPAEPDTIDLRRFERLVVAGTARLDAGDPEHGAEVLRQALALWRGPPMQEFTFDDFAQTAIRQMNELRLSALEGLASAELALGHDQLALQTAESVIVEAPTREHAHRTRLQALYRTGRQTDALREFARLRRSLIEEFGQEPSPDLQRLYEQILIHDPALRNQAAIAPASFPANPYKGLRPFGEDDSEVFFGRDTLLDQMVDVLATRRVLCVLGPSGSGKTSAVDAGLIPRLRRGALPGSETWDIARIGLQPRSLIQPTMEVTEASRSRLETLLVIDQFERVFTDFEPTERDRFLTAVIDAVSGPESTTRLVLTLRADFYDRPLLIPELAAVLVPGVVTVMPLTADELEAAIVEPARRAGVGIELALLAVLVADTIGRSGTLPLLQFTLTEHFDDRSGDLLTLADYRATGGLVGILGRRAEEAFSRLDTVSQAIATQVFLRMARAGPAIADVGRRVPVGELTALDLDPVALADVLVQFGGSRLICFGNNDGAATVEVAHERLLGEWTRLAGWIATFRSDLGRREELAARMRVWQTSGRDNADLLSGWRLDEFEAWSRRTALKLTSDETSFLAAAVAHRDAKRAEEIARGDRERVRERRARRWTITFVAVATLLGVGGARLTTDHFAPPAAEVVLVLPGPWLSGINNLLETGFDRGIAATGLTFEKVIESYEHLDERVEQLSDDGSDLIIVGVMSPGRAASNHPDTHYIALEYPGDLPNVSTPILTGEEGAFLMGVVAGSRSTTGQVGFIGGGRDGATEAFEAGFTAGVAHVAPDSKVRVDYLTETPRGFTSLSLARQAAHDMYASGVDVIFHVAGEAGQGVVREAFLGSQTQDRKLWAIGVGSDQYLLLPLIAPRPDANPADWTPHVLTTLIPRYDLAIQSMIEDYAANQLPFGPRKFGLADGAFEISYSGGFIDDLAPLLKTVEEEIISGEIRVPALPDR